MSYRVCTQTAVVQLILTDARIIKSLYNNISKLVDVNMSAPSLLLLLFSERLRLVSADGSVAYENGDLTPVRSLSSYCQCGYKHWWNGREYDNPPDSVSGVSKHACCRWG